METRYESDRRYPVVGSILLLIIAIVALLVTMFQCGTQPAPAIPTTMNQTIQIS